MSESVLITGADGYFGGLLTEKYLRHSDKNLLLWLHANNKEAYQYKCENLKQKHPGQLKRLKIHGGDLRDNNPLAEVKPSEVTSIIHTAAITRSNVEEETANDVNREGTLKIASFAQTCSRLERFSFVSTIYSSGLAPGSIAEAPVNPRGPFANHYERSKCEAEYFLQKYYSDLPWNIFRAATIIADDNSGKVIQYNVFHNTMRLFFHGLISLFPGVATTPIYLTTGTSTIDAIFHILNSQSTNQNIYNVCYKQHSALTLGELIDRVFLNFSSNAEFQKKRILKPLFTDLDAFESLASVLKGLSGAVVQQALDGIRPFAKQLFIVKDPVNDKVMEAYPDYETPDMHRLIDNVIQYLMITKWGREVHKGADQEHDSAANKLHLD